MPRASQPIDTVTRYFETAPLAAAEQALHIMRGVVKRRQTQSEPLSPAPTPKAPAKRRKPKPPKPPKPAQDPSVPPAGSQQEG